MVKKVRAEDAVGKPLAHDVICYGPNLKSVLFKRGHVIALEDVERLKDTGDYYVLVAEADENGVHEEDAAIRMANAAGGDNVFCSKPTQGKVNLFASAPGLLKVNVDVVINANLIDDFIISTKPNNGGVRKGELVGSVKIVPLSVDETRMRAVEEILKRGKPVFEVVPPKIAKIGVVITGTEVYDGRIKDAFEPALNLKLAEYGLKITERVVVPDNEEKITSEILAFKERGNELIMVTSGMAVDAGDLTPTAIKRTGADVVSRGIPIFPGSMTMVAYLGNTPVIGLPACVIPDKVTAFDFLLPRILAKERITREEIANFGHGGSLK